MPCRHPLTHYVAGAMACVMCAAVVLEQHPTAHMPEPGVYRPLPGPAYSIGSNYKGGTAIASNVQFFPIHSDREF